VKTIAFISAILTLLGWVMPAGCSFNPLGSDPPGFKYKLSLAVETPDGIKTGFNVVEISHASVSIPAGGTMTRARGEALYLDLGPGRRPLIALLTGHRDEKGRYGNWGEFSPFNLLARLYGERFTDYGMKNENIPVLVAHRGAKEIAAGGGDLPDLVTFGDINDPKTVMAVDPKALEATLGPGIKWKSITLEVTDEPLTTGIETKLGWLKTTLGTLDGLAHRPYDPYIEQLTHYNFQKG
jgi:hypothetical protein